MTRAQTEHSILPDTQHAGLLALLPARARPFVQLARFERPIGWWLLYWPCLFGLGLSGGLQKHWLLSLWMLLGAIAMRGAGCVYNDIVDRDLDRRVARTASRPLASGAVSIKAAWVWLVTLALVGLVVLVQLRWQAQLVALTSLALVAAYPFMKRITWWPQAWLGLVFSWGAPVGWFAIEGGHLITISMLYVGTIAWVIGYDTIYALQDREDDALAGIKSSALALGAHARSGVAIAYFFAALLWAGAIWSVRPHWLGLIALIPACLHFAWQIASLRPGDAEDALAKFRSNRTTGLLVALAMVTVGAGG